MPDSKPLKNDDVVVLAKTMPWLEIQIIFYCPLISDYALVVIGQSLTRLKELYMNECPQVTDYGVYAVVRGNGNLTNLKITGSQTLTISSIQAIMNTLLNLEVLALFQRISDNYGHFVCRT